MFAKKRYKVIVAVFFGILTGCISYLQADSYLNKYYDGDKSKYSNADILNVIFISKNIRAIDYLDEKNIMLPMLLIMFIIIGFLLCSNYLSVPDKYTLFLATKCNNTKELSRAIKSNYLMLIISYTFSYITTLYIMNGMTLIRDHLTLCISYILFLDLMVNISYIVYKRYSSSIAIVTGMIMICLILMLDMYQDYILIILYAGYERQISSILVLSLLCISTDILTKYFQKKEIFHVH